MILTASVDVLPREVLWESLRNVSKLVSSWTAGHSGDVQMIVGDRKVVENLALVRKRSTAMNQCATE